MHNYCRALSRRFQLITIFCLAPLFILQAQQADYLTYHNSIRQAEELIAVRKFTDALSVYEELLSQYDFVFLRDCKVATQLALYKNQEDRAFRFLERGIKHGWQLKAIKKEKFLRPLLKKNRWQAIEQQYPSLHTFYWQRLNIPLRNTVQQLFKKDQKMALGALFRIGQRAQDKYAERKFLPHSKQQLFKLDSILQVYGYPGEQLIGNNYWAETILSHHNSISQQQVQQDTLYTFLKPKLLIALRKGQISPFEFALIDNWKISVGSGWKEKSYGFLSDDMTAEETQRANEMRKQLGLRSLQTRNALIDIQQETGMDFQLPERPGKNKKIVIQSN